MLSLASQLKLVATFHVSDTGCFLMLADEVILKQEAGKFTNHISPGSLGESADIIHSRQFFAMLAM